MCVEKKECAKEEAPKDDNQSPTRSDNHTTQDNIGNNDTYYFHSHLSSNAIITINGLELGAEKHLTIELLTMRYLIHYTNYEIISNDLNSIKIKFVNKTDAQSLKAQLVKEYPQLSTKIDYDTLTHPGNIYVRGLVPEVTTQDLYEIFEPFGEITSCKIATDEFGQSRGYGFVNFLKGDSAHNAITKLNGLLINGSTLYLNHHIAKKERAEKLTFEKQNFTNLYFKNLPSSFDEAKAKELFSKFGEIHSIFLPDNGNSDKKFGFVNYKKHESAIEAILNLDNKELSPNLFLSVSRAQRKDERRISSSISPPPPPLSVPVHMPIPTINGLVPFAGPPVSSMSSSPKNVPRTPNSRTDINTPTLIAPIKAATLPLPGPYQQQSNLYVKNLTQNIDDKALYDLFGQFGSIISAKIITLEDGITSRGFGFVCFKTVQEASGALLATNGAVIDGEVIYVSFAQKNNKKLQNKQNRNSFTYRPSINNGFIPMYYGHQQPQPQLSTPLNDHFYYSTGFSPNFQRNNYSDYKPGYKKRSASVPTNIYSELSHKLSNLHSKDDKFNILLEDLIEPKFREFNNDPSLKETELHESSKAVLQKLIEKYQSSDSDVYLELINDVSNGDTELLQTFEELKI